MLRQVASAPLFIYLLLFQTEWKLLIFAAILYNNVIDTVIKWIEHLT